LTTALWVATGALLGWLGYTYLDLLRGAGSILSIIVGVAGAIVGGKLVAPMFVDATAVPGAFSLGALLFATAFAAAFLFVGSLIHSRMDA
jgi:uncharacterized membrane protein YeaQ/YmgE (transglycosylase-associated protein family)